MRHLMRLFGASALALGVSAGAARSARAQAAAASSRLEEVLPADVATRIRTIIASARSHNLPSEALENRALKFAAKGVRPDAIEKSVAEQAARMQVVRDALAGARASQPAPDEIEAGAEAMRKGLDGGGVIALAKSAPSGRSLAVPLYVIGSLVDRGLQSDAALRRVQARLSERALDRDLEKMPAELPAVAAGGNKPAETGRELAETKKPGSAAGAGQSGGSAGGPPAGVPANGGAGAKPKTPPGIAKKPTPPGKKP